MSTSFETNQITLVKLGYNIIQRTGYFVIIKEFYG